MSKLEWKLGVSQYSVVYRLGPEPATMEESKHNLKGHDFPTPSFLLKVSVEHIVLNRIMSPTILMLKP